MDWNIITGYYVTSCNFCSIIILLTMVKTYMEMQKYIEIAKELESQSRAQE